MAAGQPFPEQHTDRPHVGGRAGLLPTQALGRDVRQRPRDVADRRQRLLLAHEREPEVEQLHAHAGRFGEEHVRGLHVAMDDSLRMGVRQTVEDLRRRLQHVRVAERLRPQRLTQRPPDDVLVGDVDVAGIAGKGIGA